MKSLVLNEPGETAALVTGGDISQQLRSKIDNLKLNFFDMEKGGVNYEGMRNSDAFEDYKAATRGLASLHLEELATRQAKLAFWINIYNALVVHGILELDIGKSVKEVPSFFKAVCYNVGGYVFSLDDIEHGILRGNRKKHLLSPKPFSGGDPRKKFVVEKVDPRIHFALVCGSNSCPPIDVYEEKEIDEQLELVASGFINSEEVIVEEDSKRLRVSRIFKWYEGDFGGREGVLSLIIKYRYDPKEKDFLKKAVSELRILYNDYDWSLNLV
ncbi:MAG: DUF547 domain-containing protein [Deltaproteobacteria bacterium]|nr:DUF547 domain-containing protein [Deltaproteobacteria bacterium]